jgi:hypothetical protein
MSSRRLEAVGFAQATVDFSTTPMVKRQCIPWHMWLEGGEALLHARNAGSGEACEECWKWRGVRVWLGLAVQRPSYIAGALGVKRSGERQEMEETDGSVH